MRRCRRWTSRWPQHAGQQLELGGLPRVLARTRIGGDRLAANVGEFVIFTELVD
jgi:hypothetical protein